MPAAARAVELLASDFGADFAAPRGSGSKLLLNLTDGALTERTLSLTRRPADVARRVWRGVGEVGALNTPRGWRPVTAAWRAAPWR